MKLSDNEINNMLNKKDFISPFLHNTDIRGFIQDIKKYLSINGADPKGEAKDYIKSVIIKNGIDNPDVFLKKYIFINLDGVYSWKNPFKN